MSVFPYPSPQPGPTTPATIIPAINNPATILTSSHVMRSISRSTSQHANLTAELRGLEASIGKKQRLLDASTYRWNDRASRSINRRAVWNAGELKRTIAELRERYERISVKLAQCEADLAYWSSLSPIFAQPAAIGMALAPGSMFSPYAGHAFPMPPTSHPAMLQPTPATYVPTGYPGVYDDHSQYFSHGPVATYQPNLVFDRSTVGVYAPMGGPAPRAGRVWHVRSQSLAGYADIQPDQSVPAGRPSGDETGMAHDSVDLPSENNANRPSTALDAAAKPFEQHPPAQAKRRNRRPIKHLRNQMTHQWAGDQVADAFVRSGPQIDPFTGHNAPVGSVNASLAAFKFEGHEIGRHEIAYPVPDTDHIMTSNDEEQGKASTRLRDAAMATPSPQAKSPEQEDEVMGDCASDSDTSSDDTSIEFILGDQTTSPSTWFAARMEALRLHGPGPSVAVKAETMAEFSERLPQTPRGTGVADTRDAVTQTHPQHSTAADVVADIIEKSTTTPAAQTASKIRRTKSATEFYCTPDY